MPSLNRKDMPQINTQNLSKAIDMASDKTKITKGKIVAGKLKKSQKQLYRDKIEGIAARFTSPNKLKPLIISKDNHIVDGHHRWAAAIHKWGTNVKIPIIRINLSILDAIKLYKDIANSLDEVMSVSARKKLARKSKSKLRRGIKKRIKKMKKKRSNSDLQKAAERKAKTILMQKMMKKSPADMSMNDKVKFSEKLAKSPGKIQKVAKKILPKLKQAETERVRTMKARNTQKNEAITIPIEIGDTVLGGKFKNKRIVVKSIDKNEKGDITINGKPLMKFRLVNEQIGYGIECKNCNHNWDIEPSDDRPYLCHSCGYDSQMQKIDMIGLKDWKYSLKESKELDDEGDEGLPVIRRDGASNLNNSGQYSKVIESEIDEANAVSGGKVHKFITGKNLTFKGKKYPNLYFEVLRIDNKSKLVTLKILSPKPLFGNEINVPFRTIQRGPFLKTDTSGLGESTDIEEVAKRDYKKEYEKYGKSEKAKKYRAELNKYNRDKGTYGNGDGKDASHKGGKIVGFEAESKNRGRREKSRLKKESSINEIPMGDLQKIDTFADKKLNPMDVVLTGKHFFDRLNDPRNGKEISSAELIGFFKRLSKKKDDFVKFLDQYNSLVAVDDRTNINIPFMKQANKAIAKTVMRKKDFKSSDKKLDI